MEKSADFTQGKILTPLLGFAVPVLLAMLLQAMYGAVDLLIVGQFGSAADVSAVATGGQVMQTITSVIVGLAMGTTILVGQKIGEKKPEEAGNIIGSGIVLFAVLGIVITGLMLLFASPLCELMRAPKEAFDKTVQYVQICSGGALFIVAYNVLASVFRGIGDSKTPLMTVLIACFINIGGDLLFVAVFHMAAAGAALATVIAQTVSVVISFAVIKKKGMPFPFSRKNIKPDKRLIAATMRMGFPIALQDGLVSMSFLAITMIVNSLGVIASAGVGVAEKLCMFIMLVPSSFMQSMSAFVAQNIGAGKLTRAKKAMAYGMITSFGFGLVMFYAAFFHGDILSNVFTKDAQVIAASAQYLKAYGIDCMLTAFLFCFIGYFNGCGKTTFVMIQGIIGAFAVRIPVSYLMSQILPVSLFKVGLATPCSSIVQIILCVVYFYITGRSFRKRKKDSIEKEYAQ